MKKQRIHPVYGEWHYPILTRYGYEAITQMATGMVRHYDYINRETGAKISVHTGVNRDYWIDDNTGHVRDWDRLEPYLKDEHSRRFWGGMSNG